MPDRDSFLECQGPARHAWFLSDADADHRPMYGVPVLWRCERCGTVRIEAWSRVTGELIGRRYIWPEGYRWGRDERPSSDDFRRMWLDTHDPTVTPIRRGRRTRTA